MIISPQGAALATFKRPARCVGGKAYPIGGGIASMATAAFLIRDGDLIGGRLGGLGRPEEGLRGGRMIPARRDLGRHAPQPTLNLV